VPFGCLAAAMAFGTDTKMGNWLTAKAAGRQTRKGGAVAPAAVAPAVTGRGSQELSEGETTAS
jgi:hypothetical protein